MGCDIHMHYEVKDKDGWKLYDWKNEFVLGKYEDDSTKYNYDKMFSHPLYVGRNYDLFAILADVRNGIGFAGVSTGEGFVPIREPRGLPDDVTSAVNLDSDEWGSDGHSHSWLSLSEIMNYDWNQTTRHYGVVSKEEYLEYKKNGKPSSWCGGISGGSVRMISNEDMDYVSGDSPYEYYTRVAWEETYKESVGDGWFETMKYLSDKFGTDNVRLVFWFDN